jgi:hypothetical protein
VSRLAEVPCFHPQHPESHFCPIFVHAYPSFFPRKPELAPTMPGIHGRKTTSWSPVTHRFYLWQWLCSQTSKWRVQSVRVILSRGGCTSCAGGVQISVNARTFSQHSPFFNTSSSFPILTMRLFSTVSALALIAVAAAQGTTVC